MLNQLKQTTMEKEKSSVSVSSNEHNCGCNFCEFDSNESFYCRTEYLFDDWDSFLDARFAEQEGGSSCLI